MIYLKTYESFSFSPKYKRPIDTNSAPYEIYKKYIKHYLSADHVNGFDFLQKNKDYEKEDFEEVIKILNRDCSKFMKELTDNKQYPMFRGARYADDGDAPGLSKKTSYDERQTIDTNREVSKLIDDEFQKEFGVRVRGSNSIFSSKSPGMALDYGNIYIFFPIGDYKYFWNPEIQDLYGDIQHLPWYQGYTNPEDYYYYKYGEPGSEGHWVHDDKEYLEIDDLLHDFPDFEHSELVFKNWVPNITYEEFLKEIDYEINFEIECIVDGYKTLDIKDATNQEIVFNCKEYYLVNAAYYRMFCEYLGLRTD